MSKRTIKDLGQTTFEIKKIIFADGTEYKINKITGFAIIKEKQEGNNIDFKLTYTAKTNDDLLALSNECFTCAVAFKLMIEKGISFDEAVKKHDSYIEEERKKMEKINF